MRLINAHNLGLTDLEIVMCDGDYKEALKMILNKIDNAPTVDAIPIEWLKTKTINELCELLENWEKENESN